MKMKLDKKHAFLVLFVAALTVFALTGVGSATSQSFYFHDTDYTHTQAADGTTHACNKDMDKDPGTDPVNTVDIDSTHTAWWYDFAATVDSTFGENSWSAEIFYTSTADGTVTVNTYLVQDDGTIVKHLASGSASITSTGSRANILFMCPDDPDTTQEFSVGQRIAARVSYTGAGTFTIHYDGTDAHSHVNTPSTDPGFPVPELPTIILMSTGLLALFGYVAYRRRNNKSE